MNYENELEKQISKSRAELHALKKAKEELLRVEGECRFQTFLDSPASVLKLHSQNSFNLRYDGPNERAWFGEGKFEPIDSKIELPEDFHPLDGAKLEFHLETGFGVEPNHCEDDNIIDISYRPKTDDFMVYFRCNDHIYGRERLAKFISKYKIKLDSSPLEKFKEEVCEYIDKQIAFVQSLNSE